MYTGAIGPYTAPIVPALEQCEHIVEVADRNSVDAEARDPVGGMVESWISHLWSP